MSNGIRIPFVWQDVELEPLPVAQPASFCYFGDDAFATEDLLNQVYEDAIARRVDSFDIRG